MTREQYIRLTEIAPRAMQIEDDIKAIREYIAALLTVKGATMTISVSSARDKPEKKHSINDIFASGGMRRVGDSLYINREILEQFQRGGDNTSDAMRYVTGTWDDTEEPKQHIPGLRLSDHELSDTASVRVLDIILKDKKEQLEKYRTEIVDLVTGKL